MMNAPDNLMPQAAHRDIAAAACPEFRTSVLDALILQIPLVLLFSLILDDGTMAKVCGISLVSFWAMTSTIWLRRRSEPSLGDLCFIQWGFLLVFSITFLLATVTIRLQ